MEDTHKSCSICLEDMNGKASFLPCFHGFHQECFAKYITEKVETNRDISCPMCRVVHFAYGDKNYSYIMNRVRLSKQKQMSQKLDNSNLLFEYCSTPTRRKSEIHKHASVVIDIKPSPNITGGSSQQQNDIDGSVEVIWLKYRYYIIITILLCVLAFVLYMIVKKAII